MTRSPLRGREAELATLRDLLHRAEAGRLAVAVIEGEPGIGKSRLLADALRMAESIGFGWAIGRATELETTRPFGAIGAALAAWSDPGLLEAAGGDGLLDLVRTSPSGEDPGLHHRLISSVVDLLERLALQKPLALALEDAHFADAATLRILESAAARLQPHRALIVATVRPLPRSPQLEAVVDRLIRGGAAHIRLGELDEPATHEIAVDVLGAAAGPQLERLIRGTAGNPLYLTELLAVLQEQGALTFARDGVEVSETSLPPGLRLTILRRLSFLPQPSIELLRLAAILGESFQADELAAFSGRTAVELLGLLDAPQRAGILEDHGGTLRFRHALIRDAVYADVSESLRISLHRQAGRALASAGYPASRVAHHLTIGASVGDKEAISWLRRAAADSGARDPTTGIGLLRNAMSLLPAGDEDAGTLAAELATLLAYAGDMHEAEEVARSTLAAAHDPELDGPLGGSLIQALFAQGRWSEMVGAATAILASATLTDRDRARLLAERALGRVWTGDADGARIDAEEAVRLGREVDDPVAICFGLGHLSVLADRRGAFSEGLELARQALAVGLEASEARRRHPHMALGMALVAADRLTDAVEALRAGQRLGEREGTAWDLPLYHSMIALPMAMLGEWDDAIAEAQAGISLSDDIGSGAGRVTAFSILAMVAIARGELDEADAATRTAEAIVDTEGPQWGELWLAIARARLMAARGAAPNALGLLRGRWETAVRGTAVEGILRLGPDLVRLALQAGEPAFAAAVAEEVDRTAERSPVRYGFASARLCRGLVAGDREILVEAVAAYRPTGRMPETAAALADAAVALAGSGDAGAARQAFEEAVAIFGRLGAQRELQETLARMRSVGLRRGVRTPRRRTSVGWEALTETEHMVVALAAAGLTNAQIGERLFISPRTVQTHMAHIFAKLGLASRVELAATAARRGLGRS